MQALEQIRLFFSLPVNTLEEIDGKTGFTIKSDIPCFVEIIKSLNAGGYGKVFLAERDTVGNKDTVAVKIFNQFSSFIYEVFMMRQIQKVKPHFIVEQLQASRGSFNPLLDFLPFPKPQMMILMRLESFDARDLMFVKQEYSHLLGVILGACIAVKDLHTVGIIHQEIRPANIFIRCFKNSEQISGKHSLGHKGIQFVSVLGDVKIACKEQNKCSSVAPFDCAAPEMFTSGNGLWNSKAVDIWSLGGVLVRLITGHYVFEKNKVRDQAKTYIDYQSWLDGQDDHIKNALNDLNSLLGGLLGRMLSKDPGVRPQIGEVLKVIMKVIDDKAGSDEGYRRIKESYNNQKFIKRSDETKTTEDFNTIYNTVKDIGVTRQSDDENYIGATKKSWCQIGSDRNIIMLVLQVLWNLRWPILILYIVWRILKGIFFLSMRLFGF